jgi:hypothetical protein
MSDRTPLDPRVGELLSALLDGAVTDEERAIAEAWLERSEAARAEYRSLALVKATLGGLGDVEPPFGYFDRMLRQGTTTPTVTSAVDRAADRRRSQRARVPLVVSLVASAAAFVFIGGTAAADRAIDPPVEDLAAGEVDDAVTISSETGSVQALRQEAGGVEWDQLPEGERLDANGFAIWRDLTTDDGEERVVVARDGVVVSIAGQDVEPDQLIAAGESIIEEQPADLSFLDRARAACEALLDSLSLG